ncbi:hypothetical protein T4E_11734 [Trichinella pseudospiralis]|uniref:Integrase zinc-binding domain-containing protein n=1 Tax=Trichinella pseudospiralis TaxID=6337 RepID=A0A0V0YAU8_TRIPS|nr:hypothetical protein T4E_11734 [Trichinella pseudospiralis]
MRNEIMDFLHHSRYAGYLRERRILSTLNSRIYWFGQISSIHAWCRTCNSPAERFNRTSLDMLIGMCYGNLLQWCKMILFVKATGHSKRKDVQPLFREAIQDSAPGTLVVHSDWMKKNYHTQKKVAAEW